MDNLRELEDILVELFPKVLVCVIIEYNLPLNHEIKYLKMNEGSLPINYSSRIFGSKIYTFDKNTHNLSFCDDQYVNYINKNHLVMYENSIYVSFFESRVIYVFDAQSLHKLHTIHLNDTYYRAFCIIDGKIYAHRTGMCIYVLDMNGKSLSTKELNCEIYSICADNGYLYILDYNENVFQYSSEGVLLNSVELHPSIISFCVNDEIIYVSRMHQTYVHVYDFKGIYKSVIDCPSNGLLPHTDLLHIDNNKLYITFIGEFISIRNFRTYVYDIVKTPRKYKLM